jgi:hypothetical protein
VVKKPYVIVTEMEVLLTMKDFRGIGGFWHGKFDELALHFLVEMLLILSRPIPLLDCFAIKEGRGVKDAVLKNCCRCSEWKEPNGFRPPQMSDRRSEI